MKIASGRGRENSFQGMGRVWEKMSFSIRLHKNMKQSKIYTFFFTFSHKKAKILMSLLHQGGVSPENFSFSAIGGVKICLREGDCVLGRQPMGIPPFPLPLPIYASTVIPNLHACIPLPFHGRHPGIMSPAPGSGFSLHQSLE